VFTISDGAKYAQGSAGKSFVRRLPDDKPLLAGYPINSTALIVT